MNNQVKRKRLISRKLADVMKLSVRSQLTYNRQEKVALLIEMLETIAKGTKYDLTVKDAVNDFYRGTKFGEEL